MIKANKKYSLKIINLYIKSFKIELTQHFLWMLCLFLMKWLYQIRAPIQNLSMRQMMWLAEIAGEILYPISTYIKFRFSKAAKFVLLSLNLPLRVYSDSSGRLSQILWHCQKTWTLSTYWSKLLQVKLIQVNSKILTSLIANSMSLGFLKTRSNVMANSASLRQISSDRQSCAACSFDTCSSMVSTK